MSLETRKLSYALGAEICGVDISKPLSGAIRDELQHLFGEHCLLLFRGHRLTREQFVAVTRLFGEPGRNQARKLADYPEIQEVVNTPKTDGSPIDADYNGSDWHADISFRPNPTIITLLRAVEVPPVGGDTQFANLYLAYETLSDGLKRLLERLEGVHMQQEKDLDHSSPERLESSRRERTTAHRLVKRHPETDRKLLYMSDKVVLIAGMTPQESKPLLDYLKSHIRRPQFVYRHQWQRNDLIVWDQRCLNHNALGDFDRRNHFRHLDKTTIAGTSVGYLYSDSTNTRNMTHAFTY